MSIEKNKNFYYTISLNFMGIELKLEFYEIRRKKLKDCSFVVNQRGDKNGFPVLTIPSLLLGEELEDDVKSLSNFATSSIF